MLILLTSVRAFGWTFGKALVALGASANMIPHGQGLLGLLAGPGHQSTLLYGSVMMLVSTVLLIATELKLSAGWIPVFVR